MAYSDMMGVADFLQSISHGMMELKKTQDEHNAKLGKIDYDLDLAGIKSGRLQVQPDPIVHPASDLPGVQMDEPKYDLGGNITNRPLSSVNDFTSQIRAQIGKQDPDRIQNPSYMEDQPSRPLTIEEQKQKLAADIDRKTVPFKTVTKAPEEPNLPLASVETDSSGNTKKTYKAKPAMTEYQKEHLAIEKERADTLRKSYGKKDQDAYLRAYALAQQDMAKDLNSLDLPEDERLKQLNDRVDMILSGRQTFQKEGAPAKPSSPKSPKAPSKIRVKLIKTGQTGTIDSSEFDPKIYQRL